MVTPKKLHFYEKSQPQGGGKTIQLRKHPRVYCGARASRRFGDRQGENAIISIIHMQTEEHALTQEEINEIFRQANRAAIASKQDPELARIIEGIKADFDFAKNAVRTVGVSGYRKHLEAKGYRCKQASLKRGLVETGIQWAKHRKAKPGPA